MDTNRVETLIRELDMQREAYINTFQKVHDLLTQNLAASAPSTGLPRSETRSSPQSLSRAVTDPEATLLNSSTEPSSFKASSKSKSTGDDSDPEEDEEIYVQTPLDPRSYDEEGLRNHLRSYSWTPYGRKLLDGVVGNPSRVSAVPLLPTRGQAATDRSFATDCQVFDVGPDGSPLPVEYGHLKPQHGQATVVWNSIKEINPASKQRHAVGRITILREPSPILFGAIHYTMHKDFDVDEIFRHLYEAESSSANLFNRAFDEDPRRQRSFVFNFEYFTLIGENCQPMAWQLAAGQEDRKPGHIAITRCSSVVALVLSGSVIKEIKSPGRRKAKERGPVYDPFSPWQILNIQCYPDLRASTNVHDSTKHYVNGPDAFMSTLLGEFRDARLRFGSITKKISRQVRPPLEFMFDSDLRDKLLFEDNEYSMAKKYFWAHQTLGIMNESIKSMIDSYEENFTREVWEGKHRTLWPLLDQKSPRNAHFRKRMAELKIEFEHEIMNLRKLNKENNDRRKEIEGLREDLFTGTSIQESRKSVNATETTVQQGHVCMMPFPEMEMPSIFESKPHSVFLRHCLQGLNTISKLKKLLSSSHFFIHAEMFPRWTTR